MPAATVADYTPPELGLPYFGLSGQRHTNCCGVQVLVPTLYAPYLGNDPSKILGTKRTSWGRTFIYGKKVYYCQKLLRARAKREEVTAAFREGLKDVHAGAMVRFFFVPTYLLAEVDEMILAHEDKKYFRRTRQVKTGAFYVLSTGVL